MGLAALVMVSVSLLQPGSTQAMARSPVRLLANAVGDIHLGTSQTTAIKELSGTFGKLKTVRFQGYRLARVDGSEHPAERAVQFRTGQVRGLRNW